MTNPIESPNSDDKLWAGLSYAGLILLLIPTIAIFALKKGESDYIKFHGLQAIGFWLAGFVIQAALVVVSGIPVLGLIFGLFSLLVGFAFFGGWVYLMIAAFTGKDPRIPFLANLIETNLMR